MSILEGILMLFQSCPAIQLRFLRRRSDGMLSILMAGSTRSKSSSSEKMSQDGDLVSLTLVRELMKTQESIMKSFFATFVENTNKRFDKLIEEVQEIKTSLEFTQKDLSDLKQANDRLAKTTEKQHSDIVNYNIQADDIEEQIMKLENKADDLENRSRRNNLCFDGIKEDVNEQWPDSERKIRDLLSKNLNISTDEFTIERAHRVGRKDSSKSKPRPIVAKFQNYKTREKVLDNKKRFRGTNVFVREDFSEKVLTKRKDLLPKMYEERKKGNIAFLDTTS